MNNVVKQVTSITDNNQMFVIKQTSNLAAGEFASLSKGAQAPDSLASAYYA